MDFMVYLPSILMVFLVFVQVFLMYKQKEISELVLDLQRRTFLPVIVVSPRDSPREIELKKERGEYLYGCIIKLKNASPFPAYNLRISTKNDDLQISHIGPSKEVELTLSRESLEQAMVSILEIDLMYMDPVGQLWSVRIHMRRSDTGNRFDVWTSAPQYHEKTSEISRS